MKECVVFKPRICVCLYQKFVESSSTIFNPIPTSFDVESMIPLLQSAIPMEERTLFELVSETATEHPHLTALVEESTLRSWTYQEVMALVHLVGLKLRETICKRQAKTTETTAAATDDSFPLNPLVCILMDRSYLNIVAILAVLSVGAAYVPIDPSFPEDRQLHILTHSQCPVAIIEPKLLTRMNEMAASGAELPELLVLDDTFFNVKTNTDYKPFHDYSHADTFNENKLAYVLYTSGSTGKPKGVMVRDSSVCNIVRFFAHELHVHPADRVLGLTTFCFDISVLEIFMPLVSGACLILASSITQKNPVSILKTLQKHGVSIMQATPTTYEMLLSVGWTGDMNIRCLVGGEACRPTVAALANKVQGLYNVYGPTETTIWSSCMLLSPDCVDEYILSGAVPVGPPIWKTSFHLVNTPDDENNASNTNTVYTEVLGEGEGELWIGGHGVALGYLHATHLTIQRFVNNPFPGSYHNTKAYRTGDLFKRTMNGDYVFVRRLDDQVKVAGFRIELGEVERACSAHPLVIQAVAVVKNDRLAVFVTLKQEVKNLREEIRETAAKTVPHYMLPSIVKAVESFPTTANGKLDRLRLANSLDSNAGGDTDVTAATTSAAVTATVTFARATTAAGVAANRISINDEIDSNAISMTEFVVIAAESISGQTLSSMSASFAALGIDSLSAVLFRRMLSQSLSGFEIDVKLLYDADTTVLSFSQILYDRLRHEQPALLQKLHITCATPPPPPDDDDGVDNNKKTLLQGLEEGAGGGYETAQSKNDSIDIGRLMLQKRELIDGLRGFVVVLILADHFLANTFQLGFRLTADTSYFVILTGFVTALQEANNNNNNTSGKSQGKSEWKPLAFLHSRFVGLFPIYWLVLFLCIPFIYVQAPTLDNTNANLGSVMVLYILGLQEWTQYCNTLLREVYYVSIIWGVVIMYAIMKTTWILTQPYHLAIRLFGTSIWIGFCVGMQVYIQQAPNSGGMHSPWAMLYFALGFFAVSSILIPLLRKYRAYITSLQRRQGMELPQEDDPEQQDEITITAGTNWEEKRRKKYFLLFLRYLPGIFMDLSTFILLFTSFFNGYNRSFKYRMVNGGIHLNPAYSRYDASMRLYGNPAIFTVIIIAAFLQPADTYPSPLTWILSKTKIMPLLGECSLAIYLIQLVFMGFYYRLGIQGIQAGEYPYTRSFANSHGAYNHIQSERWYLTIGILSVLIIGVIIQKGYQDQVVVRLHLMVMSYLRTTQRQRLPQQSQLSSSSQLKKSNYKRSVVGIVEEEKKKNEEEEHEALL